jgi:hypothetical protein
LSSFTTQSGSHFDARAQRRGDAKPKQASTKREGERTDLCFYLQEVDERELYRGYGHVSTVDYARERLGFDDRKTWTLLQLARRLKVLPELKKAFGEGKIPWTKAREATKAATPRTALPGRDRSG